MIAHYTLCIKQLTAHAVLWQKASRHKKLGMIRGHHVCSSIWTTVIWEELVVVIEDGKEYDYNVHVLLLQLHLLVPQQTLPLAFQWGRLRIYIYTCDRKILQAHQKGPSLESVAICSKWKRVSSKPSPSLMKERSGWPWVKVVLEQMAQACTHAWKNHQSPWLVAIQSTMPHYPEIFMKIMASTTDTLFHKMAYWSKMVDCFWRCLVIKPGLVLKPGLFRRADKLPYTLMHEFKRKEYGLELGHLHVFSTTNHYIIQTNVLVSFHTALLK